MQLEIDETLTLLGSTSVGNRGGKCSSPLLLEEGHPAGPGQKLHHLLLRLGVPNTMSVR